MKLSEFLSHDAITEVTGPDKRGDYVVTCPGHADGKPSLLVGQGDDGRLLLHCRAGCSKQRVLDGMGMVMSDLFSESGKPDTAMPVSSAVAEKNPLTPGDMAALRFYTEECRDALQADTELAASARQYAQERFGLDAGQLYEQGVGLAAPGGWYDGPLYFGTTYTNIARLTVPFRNTDGAVAGLQARALGEHVVRWSSPSNPADDRAWSKYAMFSAGSGLSTIVITEGPGDALAVVSAGLDAVAIRGAALAGDKALAAELGAALSGRRVVLAGDRDASGKGFNEGLSQHLAAAGVAALFVLDWEQDGIPADVSDIADWAQAYPDAFALAFQAAVDVAEASEAKPVAPVADEWLKIRWTEASVAQAVFDGKTDADGPGLLFSEGLGFHIWEGRYWQHDRESFRVRRAIQDFVSAAIEDAETELRNRAGGHTGTIQAAVAAAIDRTTSLGGDEKAVAEAEIAGWYAQYKGAIRFESHLSAKGVLEELKSLSFVESEELDAAAHLLTVNNGTINLRTTELGPHRRQDYITRCLDIDYDPAADFDRWEQFLTEIFPGDPELPEFMRRLIGYGITGETSEQCMAVLWGKGANGKSMFTDTLTEVFRTITTTTPFSTFEKKPSGGIPNDLAALKGARLVMASEGEQGSDMAEAVIKRVTGQDLISARFMRQEFFEFRPTFLIVLATNHKPKLKGQDEGLWRRLKLIPFERYFAPHERDHTLHKKLLAERQGILVWAVSGAADWYDDDDLKQPASITEATDTYRKDSDGLMGFADMYLAAEPDGRVLASDLHERYKTHMLDEGAPETAIWHPKTLYTELENRGFTRGRARVGGKQGIVFFGIRIRTDEEVAGNYEPSGIESREIGGRRENLA